MKIRDLKQFFWKWYWKTKNKINQWWYFRRKNFKRFGDWIRGWFAKKNNASEQIKTAECIVICAHPDDETLYFYSCLKEQKPFVICMSGVGSKIRKQEFEAALQAQGCQGMLLNLPDVPHMAWVWWRFGSGALKKVAKNCKDVKRVFTHSDTGESHHPHHYATSKAVQKVFSDCRIVTTAPEIPPSGEGALSQEDVERKLQIMRECYPSQIKMLETWYPWWDGYLKTEFFGE